MILVPLGEVMVFFAGTRVKLSGDVLVMVEISFARSSCQW